MLLLGCKKGKRGMLSDWTPLHWSGAVGTQVSKSESSPGANLCSSAKGVTSHHPPTLTLIHPQQGECIEQKGWGDRARLKIKEGKAVESGHSKFITEKSLAPVKLRILQSKAIQRN